MMHRTVLIATLLLAAWLPSTSPAEPYPSPQEGDWVIRNFRFHDGEVLPELKLHYRTVGKPSGEAVLILHGTGGSGKTFLIDSFAGQLFGPGQALDAGRYYIILPDEIGHGRSSKPSDGLRAHFPSYDFDDMVTAEYRLLTEHLGVRHLRLIFGGSIGGMQAWMWGEMYPTFMDALMPMQCLPVEIGGKNRMLRRVVIDSIRNDPAWRGGDYTSQPIRGLTAAQYGILGLFVSPELMYKNYPSREQADRAFDKQIAEGIASTDANDMLYQYSASRDYNPEPALETIRATVVAVNTADDSVDPPDLGVMEREIRRVPRGRYVLVPVGQNSIGHGSYRVAKIFEQYLTEALTAN